MRILQVITRMNVGGTAVYLFNLQKGLESKGIFSPLLYGKVSSAEIEDICVKNMNSIFSEYLSNSLNPLSTFKSWIHFRQIIRKERFDVIHSHTFKAGLLSRTSKFTGCRIHTLHGESKGISKTNIFTRMLYIKLEKILARKTDCYIFVGEQVFEDWINEGLRPKKYYVIPPGIEKSQIQNRKILQDGKVPVYGWLGRLVEIKDPFFLIEVAKEMKEAIFLMAGDGPLMAKIQQNCPTNVKLMGWMNREQFFEKIDALLSTSLSEGRSVSILEAAMRGIPSIVPNVGSLPEIVINEFSGQILNRNVEEFVSYLTKFERQKFDSKNIAYWAEINFGIEKMIEAHLQAYQACIKK